MKYEEPQKITALGVVIFSFVAIVLGAIVMMLIYALTALLVRYTNLPESVLKIGSVIGGGCGLIASAAYLTARGKLKGIISALIIAVVTILIKAIGNHFFGLGGYLTINGFLGMIFVVIFSFVGGVLGASIKR